MAWYNPLDWIAYASTGQTAEELQAESDRLDKARQKRNEEDAHIYGSAWYEQTVKNDNKDTAKVDVYGSLGQEFTPKALVGNLADSSSSTAGLLRGIFDSVLSFPLKTIPPVGWLILFGVVFWWVGGFVWIRGILNRK